MDREMVSASRVVSDSRPVILCSDRSQDLQRKHGENLVVPRFPTIGEHSEVDDLPLGKDVVVTGTTAANASSKGKLREGDCSFAEKDKKVPVEGNRSYVAAARVINPKLQDIFVTSIPALQPVNKGEFFEIAIPEDFYQAQLEKFTFSLIARLLLNKCASPLPIHELKK